MTQIVELADQLGSLALFADLSRPELDAAAQHSTDRLRLGLHGAHARGGALRRGGPAAGGPWAGRAW